MKQSMLMLSAFITALTVTPVYCINDEIQVTIDGAPLIFDVPPQIVDDRTLVPMRAIFEALGAEVEWDSSTRTVTSEKDDTVVKMTIGSADMLVGTKTVKLDVPPQIIDDRTLVPVRAVAESFGADVDWNSSTRTVVITAAAPEATAAPSASPISEDFGISYDYRTELETSYMRDFEITGLEKADGKYKLSYTLKTFFEGRGAVTVSFRCYDKNDKQVDSWSKAFVGTDYTWSPHEDTVTISGDTVRIEFIPNK